jgi:hypothetical protein
MGKSGGGGSRRPSASVAERAGHNVTITERGDVAGASRNLFGRVVSPATLAKLAGAQPDSRIKIMASADKLFIGFDLHDQQARYYATRSVGLSQKDGALILHNHMLEVAQPGGGVGARLFATQVKTAARLGVARIETTGAREDTRTPHPVIGYKVWPAMGYNAPVPASFRAHLPASLQGAATMLDLYEHPQGRALWSQYGAPIDLTFDLSRGSRSLATLQSYLRHKGIAWNSL